MVATQACPTGQVSPATTQGYHRRRPPETVLYQAVQAHLETWLAQTCWEDPTGSGVPAYVERDFRKYLTCGILAHGFARARCKGCGHDFLITFSCKGRGACPSCNTRRMAEIAAHLVDHVIPQTPVRQWVLSLPKRLRGFLHYDPVVAGKVLRILLQEIERELRCQCPQAGAKARGGAVAFAHRFGASLNAHYHFHCCVIEGVFEAADGGVRFHAVAQLSEADIRRVQARVRRRAIKAFVRWGLLEPDEGESMLEWHHGGGFSLDASVRIEANDRAGLERLIRYCARPPLAGERLEWADDGREELRYRLPKPLVGGQTQLMLTPLELLERLALLIPPPRIHRHRYYGVLAPNAPLRAAVTAMASPQSAANAGTHACSSQRETSEESLSQPKPRPLSTFSWAMLLARIYEIFPLVCPLCGGELEIIAFITDPISVGAILNHIGEPIQPPTIASARGPPDWEMLDQAPVLDTAQPEPEYDFDQTSNW